jgi:hypothetical protein
MKCPGGQSYPTETKQNENMKRKSKEAVRKQLLREYFLNASLIALLKQAGEETGKMRAMERRLTSAA